MARVKPDWTVPAQRAGKFSELDHIREHQQISFAAAALSAGAILIGWNLLSVARNARGYPTVMTYAQPDTSYQIRITKTYLGDFCEEAVFEADTGSGWEHFDPAKLDWVYDGNERPITAQWLEL